MTDLTEQWNKGKLPEGDYYIKRRNGYLPYDNIDSHGIWRNSIDEDIIEVLAPVPTYEEWQAKLEENAQLKKWCEEFNALDVAKENEKLKTEYEKECKRADELEDSYWKAEKENQKLKELLKEVLRHELSLKEISELTRKISEALNEKNL